MWNNFEPLTRKYLVWCGTILLATLLFNHRGWYPTYGLFSGVNSMHAGFRGGGWGGGYGIHGK